MDRTSHNLINSLLLGFSGNSLHAFMDRGAKKLRHKHRIIGHDKKDLMLMMMLFKDIYTPKQILLTWMLHKQMDNYYDSLKMHVKSKNRNYGKKKPVNNVQEINRLMKTLRLK